MRWRYRCRSEPRTRRAEAEAHLLRAAGLLRAEVATAINRRSAPELALEVIG